MRRRTFGGGGALTVTDFESPKDWGAVGDGTADDTAAFNMAIAQLPAAGGLVVVDEGDYNVPAPASLTTGGRTLYWLLAGTVGGSWSPALPGTILNNVGVIGAGDIGTTELADNAVTLDKMEHGTQGDILYYGASGEPFRLAAGTSGYFLKSQGAGANPIWAATSGSEPSDGDKGDITVSSSGTVWNIDAGVITATELAAGTITGTEIAANSIDGTHIALGSDAQGDVMYYDGTDWARLGAGTSGYFLKTNGAGANPAWAEATASGITRGSVNTTTGGTEVDFTGLAAGADRITVMFGGVSLSGTAQILIQIGDSGGLETTGYVASAGEGANPSSSTAGFIVTQTNGAAKTFYGCVELRRLTGNQWASSGVLSDGSAEANPSAGGKTLSAELDRIRITTTNGTDTIDANGGINYFLE